MMNTEIKSLKMVRRPYIREVDKWGLSVIRQTYIELILWRQREGRVCQCSQLFDRRGCESWELGFRPIKQNIHHESWGWSVFTLGKVCIRESFGIESH